MKKTKHSIALRIISIACICITVLLLPILICNLILIVKGMTDKETVPSIFGYSALVVQTNSMVPVFSGGDLVIIRECNTSELTSDDIISFYEPSVSDHSVVVTHRIVGIIQNEDGSKSFRTKGDANNTADSTVLHQNNVVGKYLTHINGLGSFISFLTTTQGMLLFIILPLCLLFGTDYLIRFFEAKKKKTNN